MPAETHDHRAPLGPEEIRAFVCERLAELLGVPDDLVTPEARLREDLDVDDFTLLDLVEAVEAELGERSVGLLDGEELSELVTVADAVDVVLARVAERGTDA